MRQVIIGMKDGKPYVINAPKKVEVIFKEEKRKKRSFKKILRTWSYQIKNQLGMVKGE